jgi:hypothetical protein
MSRPFTVTRAEARELRRRSEKLRRQGGGIPHAVVRREWLEEMERDLRTMVRGYDGSARKARVLLEALLIAEEEGVAAVAAIRRELAGKMAKKRAA